MSKHPVGYRLESSTMALIKRLSDELGMTHTDVVEEAIRMLQREIDGGDSVAEHTKPTKPVAANESGARVVHFPPSEPPTRGNAERKGAGALRLSDLVFGTKPGTGKE